MSELYLDQEHPESWLCHLAKNIASTPYSQAELDQIFFEEVHPVLFGNLLQPAGEWIDFEEEWLTEAIQNHLASSKETAVVPAGFFAKRLRATEQRQREQDLQATMACIHPKWDRMSRLVAIERRHDVA
jgi:hypothetical protein